jgi:hypothetical protein
MKITRLQQILGGILVLQLALAAFVLWPRPVASGGGEPLLAGVKVGDITALTITGDTGQTVKLAKQGEAWVAPDAGDYPADAAKVSPVLDKLVAIKTGRLVAQTKTSHAQLQVADDKFARKVEVTTGSGTQTLYLGSSAGGSTIHVRLAGQNNVYLANGLSSWEVAVDLLSWVNPVYFEATAADVTGFTLKNRNGEFAFTKDASGNWTLPGLAAGEAVNANNVVTLVSSATSVRMTKPLGKMEDAAYGMAQPAAVVTLKYKSGDQEKTTTLTIGGQDPADKGYYVKSSDSPYYVKVAEYSVQTLVERDRATFLGATPTPQTK